jgi:hypothetical protein
MHSSRGRFVVALAVATALLAPAGCGRAAADEPALLNDLAIRLDRAGDLTFTAEYRLDGGAEALIAQAQEPRRAAYVHPGGKAVFTETELANCRGSRCTVKAPPSPGSDPALDLLAATASGEPAPSPSPGTDAAAGLVAPSAAVRLVSSAMTDGATVTRYGKTIAGEPSTCVGVHGPTGFTTCVTDDGLLGSFTGTVDGTLYSFELTAYTDTADAAAFELPAGAEIDDQRPD